MTAAFFLPFMNGALDGMLNIAEELGDERMNQRPNDMANTSTPFIILTHCVGLTRYWLGSVALGRPVTRDRDAEFRAQGTVADLRQAVQALQSELQDDNNLVQFDQPAPNPDAVRQAHMKTPQRNAEQDKRDGRAECQHKVGRDEDGDAANDQRGSANAIRQPADWVDGRHVGEVHDRERERRPAK